MPTANELTRFRAAAAALARALHYSDDEKPTDELGMCLTDLELASVEIGLRLFNPYNPDERPGTDGSPPAGTPSLWGPFRVDRESGPGDSGWGRWTIVFPDSGAVRHKSPEAIRRDATRALGQWVSFLDERLAVYDLDLVSDLGETALDAGVGQGQTGGPRDAPSGPGKAKHSQRATDTGPTLLLLLRLYTERAFDDRIANAMRVLAAATTAHKKLTDLHELLPIPAGATAAQLGELLDVSGQAVIKTAWWKEHQRRKRGDEAEQRLQNHEARAATFETPGAGDRGR